MCPTNGELEDPRLKPVARVLARLGCERLLIFVAEKDHLMVVGKNYYEELKKSWGRGGRGEECCSVNLGEEHCFHLFNLKYEKAVDFFFFFFLRGKNLKLF